jgi:hypothetical protein
MLLIIILFLHHHPTFFYVCCLDFLSNLETPSSLSHGLVVYRYLVATQPLDLYQAVTLALLFF